MVSEFREKAIGAESHRKGYVNGIALFNREAMARKVPTRNGVPVGRWNRLVMNVDLQYLLMFLIGVVGPIVAVVLYEILR